jgi:hypothetical protein
MGRETPKAISGGGTAAGHSNHVATHNDATGPPAHALTLGPAATALCCATMPSINSCSAAISALTSERYAGTRPKSTFRR